MKLKLLQMTFESTQDFKENITSVRGFFATKFIEHTPLHNHITNNFVYEYPLIQYKKINQKPLLVAINEGIPILQEIFDKFDSITLNNTKYEIIERTMTIKKQDFGLTRGIHFYEFMTPWFALNQKNHGIYKLAKNDESKAELLRKVLTGNLLSMSKSLGYTVPDTIKCDIDVASRQKRYKDQDITTFCGGFMTNFCIPDYLGIGAKSSKGYGTVRKLNASDIED